jgi:hypothetical protein
VVFGKSTVAANMTLAAASVSAVIAVGMATLTKPATTILAAGWTDTTLAVIAGGFEALVAAVFTARRATAVVTVRVGAVSVEQEEPVDD